VPILINVVGSLLILVPAVTAKASLYPVIYNELSFFLVLGIPLGFGFAILRSRLWSVDGLINRVLVYGSLTGILAVFYVGLILGLQVLLGSLIGRDNRAAIVLSTLLTALLIAPLRRWIQAVIDRRFYRRKYDAAKTLAAFGATLRYEVDLNNMCEELVTAVELTMQPAYVDLWLNSSLQGHLLPGTDAVPETDRSEHS
jgi:hypothetical protein